MIGDGLHPHQQATFAVLVRIAKEAPLVLGLSYGAIEYFLISSSPFSPIFISIPLGYLYRAVYVATLFLPFASKNYWRWFGRGALAMTIEDASYWVFAYWKTGLLPVQWAWYYPVWNNVPLLYLTLPVILGSYLKGNRLDKLSTHFISERGGGKGDITKANENRNQNGTLAKASWQCLDSACRDSGSEF